MGGAPEGARSRATYCPASRVVWTELVPLLAWGVKTMEPMPSMLLGSAASFGRAATNCETVTPGSRRTSAGDACASLVTLETIRTPPDCSSPPTVICLPVIVSVIVGRLAVGLAEFPEAGRTDVALATLLDNATGKLAPLKRAAMAAYLVRLDRMVIPPPYRTRRDTGCPAPSTLSGRLNSRPHAPAHTSAHILVLITVRTSRAECPAALSSITDRVLAPALMHWDGSW